MRKEGEKDLPPHLLLGRRGERFALEYLKHRCGYQIVVQNFSIPLGRNLRGSPVVGEIDIIGYDREVLAFIEVKSRTSETIATAAAGVDRSKRRTMVRAARAYRRLMRLEGIDYRFDVVTVVFSDGGSPTITLHKGYFAERSM